MPDVKRYFLTPQTRGYLLSWTQLQQVTNYTREECAVLVSEEHYDAAIAAHTRVCAEKDARVAELERLVRNLNTDIAWRSQVAAGLQQQNEMLQLDVAALQRQVWEMRETIGLAIRQNSGDMVMTGDEIRRCEAALSATTPQGRDGG